MKKLLLGLFALLLGTAALAQNASPSDASIRELMALTGGSKLIDSAMAQMDAMIDGELKRAKVDPTMSPAQQKILDEYRAQSRAVFRDALKWERLEPVMIEIHKKSFSQEEIDGMIAFYRSPVGQAVAAKMPAVMENSMQAMQKVLFGLLPEIQRLRQEANKRMKAEEGKGKAGG